jgi:RING-box protein 1
MSDAEMEVEADKGGEAGPSSKAAKASKGGKRFEIKKWNAVAMWSWAVSALECSRIGVVHTSMLSRRFCCRVA